MGSEIGVRPKEPDPGEGALGTWAWPAGVAGSTEQGWQAPSCLVGWSWESPLPLGSSGPEESVWTSLGTF
jgi:hypothetical protein